MPFIPPLGLYIHIPWCIKKCPYCDLNAYSNNFNNIKKTIYLKHLIQDLQQHMYLIKNRVVKTIFIGGGTPNILNYKLLKILIINIKKNILIDQNTEITIELHPELITIEDILEYIKIGINRISLGVQSFNNKTLKYLGRNNSEQQTINIINQIKKYTKINFNIDIMYGLPKQNIQDCLIDLKKAIAINPNHISWYQLNIEKNTIFYYQKPNLPNDNTIWNMYYHGNNFLIKSNYKRYEISSYAKLNYFCYHNLNYWTFGDYLGIGCGAHSKLTQKNKNIIRIIKKKRIDDYCKNFQYTEKIYTVSNKNKPFEYFMNLFRLSKPIKKKNFSLYTNLNIQYLNKYIDKAISKKYIKQTKKHWILLPKGKLFFNDLIELFLSN